MYRPDRYKRSGLDYMPQIIVLDLRVCVNINFLKTSDSYRDYGSGFRSTQSLSSLNSFVDQSPEPQTIDFQFIKILNIL